MLEEKLAEILNKHQSQMQKQHFESEELKATIALKLKQMEKDYIKIADHEKIVNDEVVQA
jgi:hypothetical protein